jgi:hypothetical protein
LPAGVPYEAHIATTGCVPTRDNLHDLFNGLVWLRFAQAKAALNRLHGQEIARLGAASPRGPVRDALTVFDENGAVFAGPDALWGALVAKDWPRLFVDLRPLWAQARLLLFGHALLEKLQQPRKSMVAHVLRIPMPLDGFESIGCPQVASEFIATVDAKLAQKLLSDPPGTRPGHKPFAPLPVLGVPGWWAGNEDPAFYADAAVFRRR